MDRHIYQWKRPENPETDLYKYSQLSSDRAAKAIQQKKDKLFNTGAKKIWTCIGIKKNFE
jgi:hypothetical protein